MVDQLTSQLGLDIGVDSAILLNMGEASRAPHNLKEVHDDHET